MQTAQLTNVADFTASVIHNYERGRWTDISYDLPDYVSTRMIREHMVYDEGGDTLVWDVQTDYNDSFRPTGMYDPDNVTVGDSLVQASVPWRFYTANYSYDLRLSTFQSSRETIINFVVLKEHEMRTSIAVGLERETWYSPTSTSDNRVNGIPYYIVKNTAVPGGALNGGAPSGHTTVANISPTDYDQWRNWAGQYTDPTIDDLVSKVKKAMAYTEFETPHPHPELGYSKSMVGFYTVYPVVDAFERLAETRNDRLGSDLAKYRGQVTLAGVPITHVFYLTANDSDEPFYGINWRYLRPFSKKGEWMRLTGPKEAPNQHNVRNVFVDIAWNWKCANRRTQFVISK
jgi:hypothetical protein